jgi:diguanylate cyclase (GGDEF)-like protein
MARLCQAAGISVIGQIDTGILVLPGIVHLRFSNADTVTRMRFKTIAEFWQALFRPANSLVDLITQAHHGKISVEELSTARVSRGRLQPVVKVIAEILLELKQKRAEIATLEQETRDRIANRTDALERRIGTLQVQATRDALTGLGNRRGLDRELPAVIDRFSHCGANACLLMIDVDHFKPLNDTLGHPAGDQLLKEIAQLIRSTLRGDDQAYRCGGDEYVVVLNGCDLTAGQAIAGRLEAMVRRLTQPLQVKHPPQLSIGTCALSELTEVTAEALLKTADNRLYAVKAGRPGTRRVA